MLSTYLTADVHHLLTYKVHTASDVSSTVYATPQKKQACLLPLHDIQSLHAKQQQSCATRS